MAYTIQFKDATTPNFTSEIDKTTMDGQDFIVLQFYNEYNRPDVDYCFWLDKSTAIKFAKTLRTEINKIQD